MKNKLFIGALGLIICTIIAFNVIGKKDNKWPELQIPKPGQETAKINYDIDFDMNSLASESMVYKFTSFNAEEEANRLSKLFGFTDKLSFDFNSKKYSAKNGKKIFEFEKSTGHWLYEDLEKLDDISLKKNIPSDEKATSIAKKYLKDIGVSIDRFNNVKVVSQSSGDSTTNDYRVNYKDVYFYPSLDNFLVLGVSRIIVSVGDNDQVISCKKYCKDFEPYKNTSLKSANDAFEEVKAGNASSNVDPKAKSAKIKKVELAYWEDAGSIEEQPYMQPVWVFKGEAITDSNEIKGFDVIVPALSN